ESQAVQQQMLKQLEALSKAAERTAASDWIPVSFKLVQERHDGPPAAGIDVTLGKGSGGAQKPEAIHRVSDENGVADFGVVQPGDWEYMLAVALTKPIRISGTDVGGTPPWLAVGTFTVLPGSRIERTIVCPKRPVEHVAVTCHVSWPPDLMENGLLLSASFT